MAEARDRLAKLLDSRTEAVRRSTRIRASAAELAVSVDGVGRIELPVPPDQAEALCRIGGKAPYGRGEQTMVDTNVRDTWALPADAVHIEWGPALERHLGTVRRRLGLPSSTRLVAEFHAMLVYETGQFFLAHQDSEKHDEMIATLVVSLPTTGTGGALVVQDDGNVRTYRGSKDAPSLVAFYADSLHEVRPVTSGHRVSITYNLLVEGDTSGIPTASSGVVETAAELLDEHFTTPRTSFGRGQMPPPTRLVYLLDHEYTERGLSWSRLKGADAQRAGILRAASEHAGCDVILALTEIHETRNAAPPYGPPGSYGGRYWDDEEWADEDDWYGGEIDLEPVGDDEELLDSSIELSRWLSPDGAVRSASVTISDDEICASTPTSDLSPLGSEYEGFMGNYGNTMDRWYRRAAVMVWPRSQDAAHWVQFDPGRVLEQVARAAQEGDPAPAREQVTSLAPQWDGVVRLQHGTALFGQALHTATVLGDVTTARILLAPFRIDALVPSNSAPLVGLIEKLGTDSVEELVSNWSGAPEHTGRWTPMHREQLPDWMVDLPELVESLAEHGDSGAKAAIIVVRAAWRLLEGMIDAALRRDSPGARARTLEDLGAPGGGVLSAVARTGSADLQATAHSAIGRHDDAILGFLIPMLIAAADRVPPADHRVFSALAGIAEQHLVTVLAVPPRAPGDWSITVPFVPRDELGDELARFLGDSQRRQYEWKLATPGRRRVHGVIDRLELPVDHTTRRSGRPYTLVLTKREQIFRDEERARARDLEALERLRERWLGGGR